MSENTGQPVIQVPAGVPLSTGPQPGTVSPEPSQQAPGTGAPASPQSPGTTPSRGRTRGIPAGPAALAAANTAALAGSAAVNQFGLAGGAAVAAGVALSAAALVTKKAKSTKTSAANKAARKAAKQRGAAYSPTGRSGSPNKSGRWSGSRSGAGPAGPGGSTRQRSGGLGRSGGLTGLRSAGSGTGKHRGSGSLGRGLAGSGRISGGSGRVKPGSGRTPAANRTGSGSGPARSSGSTRQRVLRSGPNSTSLLRKAIGPRPGSGPNSRQGGLIRRGDGSKRQPIQTIKNGIRRVVDRSRKIARGAVRAYNSKVGKAARKWTVGAAKRAWKVGWPATAATVQGVLAILRRRGWRAAWDVMKDTWRAKRNKNTNAPPTGIPAATVNTPANLVGGIKPTGTRPAGNHGGGITMAQARFIQAAAEMLGAATVYQPEGMMQVGNDFAQMPGAYRDIANAMKKMAEQAHDQYPLHPAIIDMMKAIYGKLQEAATMSEDLGPAFRNLHAVDIKRIENPRRGETMWDVGANQGY